MRSPGAYRGSALLVVLGFLAIVATAAMAFSAWMRAERAPGAVLVRNERGRFLLGAALARAMSEIDENLETHTTAEWNGRVYGAADDVETNATVAVLTLEGLGYLPSRCVEGVRARARSTASARWRRFDFDAGRYAYVAVDVSDLPNVNALSACTNRTYGVGGRLSLAPFFTDEAAARAFDARTRQMRESLGGVPFVSLMDYNLSMGYAARTLAGEENCDIGPSVVVDAGDGLAKRQGGQVVLTDGIDAVRGELARTMTEEELLTLDDYLDVDHVPSSLEIPCAERVPQLGAVGLSEGTEPKLNVTVVYPFRLHPEDDRAYDLEAEVAVSSADGTFAKRVNAETKTIVLSDEFDEERNTRTYEMVFGESLLPPPVTGDETPQPPCALTFSVRCRVRDDGGALVDRMADVTFGASASEGCLGSVSPRSYGVADARLNWRPEQWKASDSPAQEWVANEASGWCSVSDAGYLQSVGELAFLPRSAGAPFAVEDFDLADDRGEGPRVDPTTGETNVVAMALVNTPVDWTSSATNAVSPRTLEQALGATRADFTRLAERLMVAFGSASAAAEEELLQAYDALDWLGEGAGNDPFEGLSFADRLTAVDRRYLRDYWRGCFGRHEQLFIIFMRVEYGPRGVAVVSRDPRPLAEDQPQKMRICFYHQFEN